MYLSMPSQTCCCSLTTETTLVRTKLPICLCKSFIGIAASSVKWWTLHFLLNRNSIAPLGISSGRGEDLQCQYIPRHWMIITSRRERRKEKRFGEQNQPKATYLIMLPSYLGRYIMPPEVQDRCLPLPRRAASNIYEPPPPRANFMPCAGLIWPLADPQEPVRRDCQRFPFSCEIVAHVNKAAGVGLAASPHTRAHTQGYSRCLLTFGLRSRGTDRPGV